ncbi:MAG: hypothetical protein EHM21_14045 [Chloroflexi bacterium]|nr:MAG: hypothetical protein EHM21_14045 [Chloroflexota bacterium]
MAVIEEQEYPSFSTSGAANSRPRRSVNAIHPPMRKRKTNDLLWNILTALVWLGMACMIAAFVSVYSGSIGTLNSVQPTLVAMINIPTMTPSPVFTHTPLPVAVEETQLPTLTSTPTLEPTETNTPGPSPTATIYSVYPFILRSDPKVLDAETFPDHESCSMWVAGQAYDQQGAPMVGITVMVGGYLDGKSLSQLSLTGTALQYGQAGYEFTLADHPIKSKQSVWVMILDQSMVPLSGKIYFDTSEDCQQNLTLVNFRQIR